MSHLPDDARLSTLSIPGTHDTMTAHDLDSCKGIFKSRCLTQEWTLDKQLLNGIRFLDIRIRQTRIQGAAYLLRNSFGIYHGSVFLDVTLDEVFLTIKKFLAKQLRLPTFSLDYYT